MTLKEQAKQNLLDFKKVMDELKIPFCLMDGTLLGAYRDKDFVKEDENDIDVGVLAEDYDISVIVKKMVDLGFDTTQAFIVEGNVEGRCVKRGGNHLDIMKIHFGKDKAFNLGRTFRDEHGLPPIFAYAYPLHCFEKFDTIEFLGTEFNIPYKTKDFLSVRYVNWNQWVSRADYDFLDKKQVPCIYEDWKNLLKKVVYTYLCSDLIHIGHIRFVQNGKKQGDYLIAGVLTDEAIQEKKPKPIMSLDERLETIKALKYVDEVVEQDTYSPLKNIQKIKPDILIESDSHDTEDIQKMKELVESYGGKVVILPYYKLQSSTAIKNKIKESWQPK